MKLLFKLLRQNVSILQTLVFMVVSLLGGVIVLLGIEAYRDFNALQDAEKESISSHIVVINKKLPEAITFASLLGIHPTFSDEEIRELESLPSVASVGEFMPARFEATANFQGMESKIFLEAIPDEFVLGNYKSLNDIQIPWSAEPGDVIPVILPRNYVNLYNFGFAIPNSMPQISDELIGNLKLELIFKTEKGNISNNAVICGLTDKFNTILVPWDFMVEANSEYMPDGDDAPSRLILSTKASDFDEATFAFFEEKGYVVEGDAMSVKLQNFVYGLLYIIIGIGAVFSILAFVLLVISILLLIEKNKEKISNLYSIGYSVKQISGIYCIFALVLDVLVWSVAAVVANLVYQHLVGHLQIMLPGLQPVSALYVWSIALLLSLLFALVHGLIIYMNVKKHCR